MPSSQLSLPKAYHLRMPAEWAPHLATWMSWPFDEEMWWGELVQVRREYATLVQTIASHEPVHLLVRDEEAERTARLALGACKGVVFHRQALDDVWMRDNGPIFLVDANPALPSQLPTPLVDWRFNAWGGKYAWDNDDLVPAALAATLGATRFAPGIVMEGGSLDINGLGLCLTTEQCLLTPTRNPGLGKAEIAGYLRDYLGVDQLVWLRDGLEGDHTDGHVDTITRFVGPRTVVTSVTDDKSDANFTPMQENREILRAFRTSEGQGLTVIDLPLPRDRLHLHDGARLPATYANFYFVNGAVLVPQYGDVQDTAALAILQRALPAHRVIGLPSRYIITGGGSFHCLTQQQPRPAEVSP